MNTKKVRSGARRRKSPDKRSIRGLILLLFTGMTGVAMAQYTPAPPPQPPANIPPTGYFSLDFGLAQPIGEFANSTNSNSYSGYALPGNNLGISLGIPISNSNFGIAIKYNYSSNLYDIDSYVNNVQFSDQNNNYYSVVQDAYRENIFLGGLFATIPVERVLFDFRVMGGLAICYIPEVAFGATATSPLASNDFLWDTYSSNSSAFAWDIGAGVRYNFRNLSLMANIDFLNTNPVVSTTEQYIDQFGNTSYSHISGTVPFSLINFDLGIGYHFP